MIYNIFGYDNVLDIIEQSTITIAGNIEGFKRSFAAYNVDHFSVVIGNEKKYSGRKQELLTMLTGAICGFGVIAGMTPPPDGITIDSIKIIFYFKNFTKTIWNIVPNQIGWYSDMQYLADMEFEKIKEICLKLQNIGIRLV